MSNNEIGLATVSLTYYFVKYLTIYLYTKHLLKYSSKCSKWTRKTLGFQKCVPCVVDDKCTGTSNCTDYKYTFFIRYIMMLLLNIYTYFL